MGEPIWKIIKAKRIGSTAQVVEHLRGKYKASSSTPIPHTHSPKKKKEKRN
jgi:hypothetical protein